MQLTTGAVVGGKLVVEGDPLPEGTVVTILTRETDEPFAVPPELEAELLESTAEADRGDTIPADKLLSRLRRQASRLLAERDRVLSREDLTTIEPADIRASRVFG